MTLDVSEDWWNWLEIRDCACAQQAMPILMIVELLLMVLKAVQVGWRVAVAWYSSR